ncbi:26S proteasome non-ATPase regulatory subunit 10-like [Oscarella lobularis]|uniref:26S proteasome non-ATPase regulatory subunit 10-like n=1 Tax=Oscarella lobularis TaxID=121494 RepID=UPI003313E239
MLESLDEQHQTPLHVAARFNRLSVVKSLLLKNADPNKKTKDEGLTPLHLCARIVPKAIPDDWTDDRAADEDGRDLALVLLKEGARLNEQDTYGMTALHHAIQRGNKAMAKFLIDYTAVRSFKLSRARWWYIAVSK